jgi:hypothetical protein
MLLVLILQFLILKGTLSFGFLGFLSFDFYRLFQACLGMALLSAVLRLISWIYKISNFKKFLKKFEA